MGRYVSYAPGQAWLLPPRTADELGEGHLVFLIHEMAERLDGKAFEAANGVQGRPAYPPQMLIKVWL